MFWPPPCQEVVDPEDLLLVEDLVQLAVQLAGPRPGRAERLLHDDPAALDEVRVLEQVDDRQRRLRRDAQVVQSPQLRGAELGLGLGHRLPQGVGTAGARCPAKPLRELGPALRVGALAAVLCDGPAGELDEGVAVVLVERGPDDLDLGEQAGLEQVQQAGQQLALGKITGGTEQDDGCGDRHGVQPARVEAV
jgi:hypothetical protein